MTNRALSVAHSALKIEKTKNPVMCYPIYTLTVEFNIHLSTEGLMEWPIQGDRELVLEGQNLNHVPGIQVFVDSIAMETKVTTNTYLVFTPPQFKELQQLREKRIAGERTVRSTEESEVQQLQIFVCTTMHSLSKLRKKKRRTMHSCEIHNDCIKQQH